MIQEYNDKELDLQADNCQALQYHNTKMGTWQESCWGDSNMNSVKEIDDFKGSGQLRDSEIPWHASKASLASDLVIIGFRQDPKNNLIFSVYKDRSGAMELKTRILTLHKKGQLWKLQAH